MDTQQILYGLATGSIYGAVALALVLIYQSTRILNFAQGEMATFTTFIASSLIVTSGIPYWIGFVVTLVIAAIIGALVERGVVRWVEDKSPLAAVVVTLGLFYIFNALSTDICGADPRPFPAPFGTGNVNVLGAVVDRASITVLVISLVLMALLAAMFRFTKVGLAMRGTTENRAAAELMGINTGRMLAIGWAIAAAVGAAAGMLVAHLVYLSPTMMEGLLINAFTAAVVGGLTSPIGAVIGGLLVGLIGNLAGTTGLVSPDLRGAVSFVIIVIVLLLRPSGILGARTATRKG